MPARRIAALVLALLAMAGCGHTTNRRGLPDTLPPVGSQLVLRVAEGGCTVVRSALPRPAPPGLSWHVTDVSGNEVDLASAVRSTRFTPDGSGAFAVQLVRDDDSDFTAVSNEVAVRC